MDLPLLGRKMGMSQIFLPDGTRKGVTILKVDHCVVVDKRTPARDGYAALVLGTTPVTGDPRRVERLVGKPMMGRFKKLGVEPVKVVREFRVKAAELDKYQVGQKLGLEVVKEGDRIDVCSTSKGRGFAGVMKRHHMAGSKWSHGTHEYRRHGGSIGCRAEPGRVHKGKRMPGHMGAERVTTQYLKVIRVMPDQGIILIDGPVPGYPRTLVEISPTTKLHPIRIRKEEVASKDPLKASKKAAKK
ncbi:MAG: 50S ribosomal protein L3 [Deltaproteobacteria bacterium]|nr:50S ribosomal protein L3 [Deltaproteobacteria bacterium]